MCSYWDDRLIEKARMRRAFGSEMVDSMHLNPIGDKSLEGTPDEGMITQMRYEDREGYLLAQREKELEEKEHGNEIHPRD